MPASSGDDGSIHDHGDRSGIVNVLSSSSATTSSFSTLPPELLTHIFLHLELCDLATLSLASKAVRTTVELHGWSAWLSHNPHSRRNTILVRSNQRSESQESGCDAVKALLGIDSAWSCKAFLARQIHFIDLPPPLGLLSSNTHTEREGSKAQRGKVGQGRRANGRPQLPFQTLSRQNQAIPILRLCPDGLLMALKSSLCFWSADLLNSKKGIKGCSPEVVMLQSDRSQKEPTAWEDISAMEIIAGSQVIVVGRVDGRVELWTWGCIHTSGQDTPHLLGSYRPKNPAASSVQAISYLSSHNLMAVAWKGGEVAIFDYSNKPSFTPLANAQVEGSSDEQGTLRLVTQWTLDARPWSIHLGVTRVRSSPWLVVGCQGIDFLRLYRSTLFLSRPAWQSEPQYTSLRASSSPNPQVLSIYALASSNSTLSTSFPPHLLFAGCYDGLVRVWDLRRLDLHKGEDGEPAILLPVQRYTDRYDPSPVYSIVLGVGCNSESFAVGTARHGVVKLFEVGRDAQGQSQAGGACNGGQKQPLASSSPQEGITIYPPAPPADFPTYSIVGEHGRLFSAGAGRLWEFDARVPLRGKNAANQNGIGVSQESEVSFSRRQDQYRAKGRWELDGWKGEDEKAKREDTQTASTSVGWYFHGEMELKRSGQGREEKA